MLEVREARYFVAVAEQLNFGRAAELLHMSQPPLSAAIKALEKRLGVVLLHRTTREVRLTPAGAVLLERCRALVSASREAEMAARRAAEGNVGELRIGAVSTAFGDPLQAALRGYAVSHPDVEVRAREIDTHIGMDLLQRSEIDVVLVRKLTPPPGCQRLGLRRDRFVLAVPAEWSVPKEVSRDLSAAADLPWVWIPRDRTPDYHDQVVACCRTAGFSPRAQHTAQSIESQLTMVASGLGVALVPSGAVRSTKSGALIRTVKLKDSATIELAAMWRAPSTTLVDGFLRQLRAARATPAPAG